MSFKSVSFAGTSFFTLPNDFYISKSLELYGEWSWGELVLLARLLRPDSRVIEAGAHIGSHSVFIARDICPKGKLFVFEPRRISFQLLCANLTANGITHAHAYRLGVGAEKARIHEGPLPLDKAYNSGGPAIGALQGEGEAYDVVALDTMIEELGAIDLIKADVQGHEGALLRGASQLISTCRPLLYLENDERERSRALIEQVMALDYRLWWHAVPVFRQNNRGRTLQNIFGNVTSFNMLCIPAERVDALTPALAGLGGLQPMTDPGWFPVATQS